MYINLIDQKEPTLNFQEQIIKKKNLIEDKILYFKKVIKPSENELNTHKEYLKKNLKKNYFS